MPINLISQPQSVLETQPYVVAKKRVLGKRKIDKMFCEVAAKSGPFLISYDLGLATFLHIYISFFSNCMKP